MKKFLLAFSLSLSLVANCYGDGLDCFNAAYRDPEVAPNKDDFWRRPDIVQLCEGASGVEPLKCYKAAYRDQELFSAKTPWERSVQAVKLCSGATGVWPISCLKSTKLEDAFKADYKTSEFMMSRIFTGLCAKASNTSRLTCFKKAIQVGGFMSAPTQHSINTYENYIQSARLCGTSPDFEKRPENMQELNRLSDERQKKFEEELDENSFWKTFRREGWRKALGFSS